MSADPQGADGGEGQAFPARAILSLILVGIVALAGFGVLATYAPELRGRSNGGAHALSAAAVGYRGAQDMLRALGTEVTVSRARPAARDLHTAGLVLTPQPGTTAAELKAFQTPWRILIVAPKWRTAPDPVRPGFVRKAGFLDPKAMSELLSALEPGTGVSIASGFQRPVLQDARAAFVGEAPFSLGRLDGLQTISGPGWQPILTDGQGRMVLAISSRNPRLYVLADPDLLNNQGLGDLGTARAGMAILQTLGGENGVVFDVTLNGLAGSRSLAKLMLEPPWLASTLCALAAAVLMGWQALARFGAPVAEGRAIALGAAALVDNSAGLIRMAGKEAALAPDYATATFSLVARASRGSAAAGGSDEAAWLAPAAERRGLADPSVLAAQAAGVRTRDDLMAVARKLYEWRLEMTRERE